MSLILTTQGATGVSYTSAILHGHVVSVGGKDIAGAGWWWGPASSVDWGHVVAGPDNNPDWLDIIHSYYTGLGMADTSPVNDGEDLVFTFTSLTPGTAYKFMAAMVAEDASMGFGSILEFTTPALPSFITTTPAGTAVPATTTATVDPVVRTPSLQAVRTLEVSTMGRFYIDEEGNATWESRNVRNP